MNHCFSLILTFKVVLNAPNPLPRSPHWSHPNLGTSRNRSLPFFPPLRIANPPEPNSLKNDLMRTETYETFTCALAAYVPTRLRDAVAKPIGTKSCELVDDEHVHVHGIREFVGVTTLQSLVPHGSKSIIQSTNTIIKQTRLVTSSRRDWHWRAKPEADKVLPAFQAPLP
jgi:hypothetical protein